MKSEMKLELKLEMKLEIRHKLSSLKNTTEMKYSHRVKEGPHLPYFLNCTLQLYSVKLIPCPSFVFRNPALVPRSFTMPPKLVSADHEP